MFCCALGRLLLLACLTISIASLGQTDSTISDLSFEFANPRPVQILGYSGDAMEPFISRDGKYLFFNNSNDPRVNTNLHWATRIDDMTFHYKGEIQGVNTNALEVGFVEAPTLSPDEKSLYFHKKDNGRFVIHRVTRR